MSVGQSGSQKYRLFVLPLSRPSDQSTAMNIATQCVSQFARLSALRTLPTPVATNVHDNRFTVHTETNNEQIDEFGITVSLEEHMHRELQRTNAQTTTTS